MILKQYVILIFPEKSVMWILALWQNVDFFPDHAVSEASVLIYSWKAAK